MTAKEFEKLKVNTAKINTYPLVCQYAIRGNITDMEYRLCFGEDPNRPTAKFFGYRPLHWSIVYGQYDAAEMLLSHGADIEGMDWVQRTPLHIAIEGHNEIAVQWLLDHGADVNAGWAETQAMIPRSPLQIAILRINCEITEILLNAGANTELSILGWQPGKAHGTSGGHTIGVCEYICHVQPIRPFAERLIEVVRRVRPDEYLDWWAGQSDPGLGL